ncbi:TPA: transposase [Vibrio parahaemolyticus]|nr:transposase [Vibrio parahaemolyticus]
MSRGAAGSRALVSMLRSENIDIGRFKVRKIMQEAGLMSKMMNLLLKEIAQASLSFKISAALDKVVYVHRILHFSVEHLPSS